MSLPADTPELALSIRQPWATLVVLGLKSIEVRRWTTPIRGRIYIHAGKMADERLEGWSHLPAEHLELTRQRGGVIGAVDLVDCISYRSIREFSRDRQLHFNLPAWFLPPRLFGFRFERPAIVPFLAISGQVKLFPVTVHPNVNQLKEQSAVAIEGKMSPKKRVTFEIR